MDDYKKVNDTYGHETGDCLLIEVAKRLNNALGENTYVSRIGASYFPTYGSSIDELISVADVQTYEEKRQDV